jgi:hypothetical protein
LVHFNSFGIFLRSFPKNICRASANILVLVLRFPCCTLRHWTTLSFRAYFDLKCLVGASPSTVWPGVDVMITIFCDFRQFGAKKMAFFSKTNVMIKILHNLALFWVEFFGENIFKNHNIGPRLDEI